MPSIFLPQTPFMRYFTCFGYFSTYAVIAVCGGFTAILKRYFEGLGVTFKIQKKVAEKFEESPELGHHSNSWIICHFHKSVSAEGLIERSRSMQMNSDDKPVH